MMIKSNNQLAYTIYIMKTDDDVTNIYEDVLALCLNACWYGEKFHEIHL